MVKKRAKQFGEDYSLITDLQEITETLVNIGYLIVETVLQPSLHNEEEWAEILLYECAARNINVKNIREELDKLNKSNENYQEDLDYIVNDIVQLLENETNLVIDYDNDSFIVYNQTKLQEKTAYNLYDIGSMFVKVGEGEYEEIWVSESSIPYNSSMFELI